MAWKVWERSIGVEAVRNMRGGVACVRMRDCMNITWSGY